ncbi:MAG: GIY-YIG nuclease family protein [Patescibacteria group bacterium]
MFTVYILQNQVGKLYTGQTKNFETRLIEHNVTGHGYTAKHRPWKVVLMEKYQNRTEAMKREKYLKTGAGRDWIKRQLLHV